MIGHNAELYRKGVVNEDAQKVFDSMYNTREAGTQTEWDKEYYKRKLQRIKNEKVDRR